MTPTACVAAAAAAGGVRRGAFILFEGVDRCGKSTQSKLLVQSLTSRGIRAELWRYPDRTTPIGRMIDSYLQSKAEMDDAAVHLLFSANRWEKSKQMMEKLNAGVTLVVDRYAYSGVAFTASKGVPGLDLAWCKASDAGLPAPDALVYLHIPVDETTAREGFGGERYEKVDFQKSVQTSFEGLMPGGGASGQVPTGSPWRIVDVRSKSIEAVHDEVMPIAMAAVGECLEGRKLGVLWSE